MLRDHRNGAVSPFVADDDDCVVISSVDSEGTVTNASQRETEREREREREREKKKERKKKKKMPTSKAKTFKTRIYVLDFLFHNSPVFPNESSWSPAGNSMKWREKKINCIALIGVECKSMAGINV